MSDRSVENVLFVVMDTVRKDRLSVYGHDRPTTPELERFAEGAAVFEQAVAPAPWTLPVHASLFTGLYPSEHGASQESPYLEGATTLAGELSAAGYATACYSSNAWITPYTRLTDGFDDQDNFFEVMPGDFLSGPLARLWKAMNDSPTLRKLADRVVALGNVFHERLAGSPSADSKTPQVVDRTMAFVEDAEAGDADGWFAFINLMDAHLPYHPPEEYASEFAPGVDSTAVCQNSKEYNSGARDVDDEEWAAIRGLYDAEVRHVDAEVGRLFDWLRAEGLWADTMVVVCADHGELHGEHGLYGHEFCIYDPLVNVPLLVDHPALDAGRRDDQVELLDLYHTVLDALGVEAPDATRPLDRSRSLLADGYRAFETGEYAFVEYFRPVVELRQLESKAKGAGIDLDEDSRFYSRMRAARRPDAKFIRNERIPDEFYRLADDPGEEHNLLDGAGGRALGEGDGAAPDAGDGVAPEAGDGAAPDVGDGAASEAGAGAADGGHGAAPDAGDGGDGRAADEAEAEADEPEAEADEPEAKADPGDDDQLAADLSAELSAFARRVGAEWTDAGDAGEGVLDDMSDEARERLQDLGYLE